MIAYPAPGLTSHWEFWLGIALGGVLLLAALAVFGFNDWERRRYGRGRNTGPVTHATSRD